jgi:hypothetical protein
MSTKLKQLEIPIEVKVVSADLPKGMTETNRKGLCLAWWMTEDSCLWLVCFHETGELVWVPMAEIRLRPNWSASRRYSETKETS